MLHDESVAIEGQAPEKREYRRYKILFPVTIRVDDEDIVAVCRDASVGGALIAAQAPVELGATVVARFRVSTELRDERTITATVVRQELSTDEMQLAFPYRIALDFDEPLPDLLDDLERRSSIPDA